MTVDDFVAKLAQAECHSDATCGHPSFTSEAACQKATGTQFNFVASVASGKVKFDATQAQACIDAVTTCTAVSGEPAACSATIIGTIAVGQACTTSTECVTGSACASCKCVAQGGVGATCATLTDCASYICTGGKCAAIPQPGKQGESCATGGGCESGLACVSPGICAPYLASGAACKGGDLCVAGFLCATDNTGSGTCKAVPNVGDACQGSCGYQDRPCAGDAGATKCQNIAYLGDACVAGQCNYDLTCDKASKKCVTSPAGGTACTTGGTECGDNGYCSSGKCLGASGNTCS